MNKLHSYTKYQKNVIKFLGLLLDNERPFFYEKTKANHLKVRIQGVDTIIYTGGTPSDVKSFSNFKAEVKRAIKAADIVINTPTIENRLQNTKTLVPSFSSEKLTSAVIKQFRNSRDVIIQQEKNIILEQQNLDSIKEFRINKINNIVLRTHKQQKSNFYLKIKQLKTITEKISSHVDFILPTLGDYKVVMNDQERPKLATHQKNKVIAAVPLTKSSKNSIKDLTSRLSSDTTSQGRNTEGSQVKRMEDATTALSNNELQQLLKIKTHNRLDTLRQLSKSESLTLIAEINQAIALNQEQSIEEVFTLIKDKEIPYKLLMQHLEQEYCAVA
jgi:hypothetical protein